MSKSLLDDWNDPHNRKMRELYAEQDRKMQAQDGNRDAADLAALRAENAKLREALRPFAEIPCLENFDDDQTYDWPVKAADVRRARAALA